MFGGGRNAAAVGSDDDDDDDDDENHDDDNDDGFIGTCGKMMAFFFSLIFLLPNHCCHLNFSFFFPLL